MSNLAKKKWWACAGTRAVKTAAQTAVAVIGTSFLLADVDWLVVGSAAALAAALSLLTSLSGLPEMDEPQDGLHPPAQ
ncbi:MAG: holin [Clostridiales Family XIII bacterium]|jgi:hypothetical protein|nr:holin [Clostridiales Family XIII bacterium]